MQCSGCVRAYLRMLEYICRFEEAGGSVKAVTAVVVARLDMSEEVYCELLLGKV